VETFATKLRDDLDKQERVLHVFIGRIKQKHQQTKLKLSRVSSILKGLKAEIANATKYADQYETDATDQSKQEKLIKDEYEKSWKMFSEELFPQNSFRVYCVVNLEHGIIKINGLSRETNLSNTSGHLEKGGFETTMSPRSFSKKSTGSCITLKPISCKSLPLLPSP